MENRGAILEECFNGIMKYVLRIKPQFYLEILNRPSGAFNLDISAVDPHYKQGRPLISVLGLFANRGGRGFYKGEKLWQIKLLI